MIKLILIRHGETAVNTKGVLHSYNDPEKLSQQGINQAKQTGNRLKSFNIDILFTSREQRAKQTATIIGETCELTPIELEGLEERNWGIYSGKPWSEIKTILDPMSLEERYKFLPPQGESWKMFETRLINTIKKIVRENINKTIAIVTHGGSIRALMPYLLSIPKEESFKYDPRNASLTIVDWVDNKISPVAIDSTEHLDLNQN